MKDRHDNSTADIFEMSDTEILNWMQDHVMQIEHLSNDLWATTYYAFGEFSTIEAPSIKDCVRLAANFKHGVANV